MNKDFHKEKLAELREPTREGHFLRGRKRYFFILAGLSVVTISTAGFFYYRHSLQSNLPAKISMQTYFSQLTKPLINRQTKRTASAASRIIPPEPKDKIQFEFYDALPATNLADAEAQKIKTQLIKTEIAVAALPASPTNIANKPITNAADLEKRFAQQLKKNPYIIQLGVYKNRQTAKTYQEKLAKAGIKVTLTAIKSGTTSRYRIQLGPYITIAHAKTAQQKLQSQGIQSLVLQS